MKTIKEIRIEESKLKEEKCFLEEKLSKELTEIITDYLSKIKKEHDAYPVSIDIDFINTSTFNKNNNQYAMGQVNVRVKK